MRVCWLQPALLAQGPPGKEMGPGAVTGGTVCIWVFGCVFLWERFVGWSVRQEPWTWGCREGCGLPRPWWARAGVGESVGRRPGRPAPDAAVF